MICEFRFHKLKFYKTKYFKIQSPYLVRDEFRNILISDHVESVLFLDTNCGYSIKKLRKWVKGGGGK